MLTLPLGLNGPQGKNSQDGQGPDSQFYGIGIGSRTFGLPLKGFLNYFHTLFERLGGPVSTSRWKSDRFCSVIMPCHNMSSWRHFIPKLGNRCHASSVTFSFLQWTWMIRVSPSLVHLVHSVWQMVRRTAASASEAAVRRNQVVTALFTKPTDAFHRPPVRCAEIVQTIGSILNYGHVRELYHSKNLKSRRIVNGDLFVCPCLFLFWCSQTLHNIRMAMLPTLF